MKHFNWKRSYETGNTEMDEQHRHLFAIANAFYDELFSETFIPDNNELFKILEDLKAYSEFHYNYEKKFYTTDIIHRYFIRKNILNERITELKKSYNSDNIIVLYGFAEFLRKWLLKHIMVLSTKDFKELLKKEVINLSCN